MVSSFVEATGIFFHRPLLFGDIKKFINQIFIWHAKYKVAAAFRHYTVCFAIWQRHLLFSAERGHEHVVFMCELFGKLAYIEYIF